MHLKVLKNKKAHVKASSRPLHEIYETAAIRAFHQFMGRQDTDSLKRFVFYSVRFIIVSSPEVLTETRRQLRSSIIHQIIGRMGYLSPRAFLDVFPLEKVYNTRGHLKEKDYFSMMERLTTHGMDEPLGAAKVLNILFDYRNTDLCIFLAELLRSIDDSNILDGIETWERQRQQAVINGNKQIASIDPRSERVKIWDFFRKYLYVIKDSRSMDTGGKLTYAR